MYSRTKPNEERIRSHIKDDMRILEIININIKIDQVVRRNMHACKSLHASVMTESL